MNPTDLAIVSDAIGVRPEIAHLSCSWVYLRICLAAGTGFEPVSRASRSTAST